jgi:hypothetical protein
MAITQRARFACTYAARQHEFARVPWKNTPARSCNWASSASSFGSGGRRKSRAHGSVTARRSAARLSRAATPPRGGAEVASGEFQSTSASCSMSTIDFAPEFEVKRTGAIRACLQVFSGRSALPYRLFAVECPITDPDPSVLDHARSSLTALHGAQLRPGEHRRQGDPELRVVARPRARDRQSHACLCLLSAVR